MARERVDMTPAEVASFVGSQEWLVLGTLEPDGSPTACIVSCTYAAGGVVFRAERGSAIHRNLTRDPRACSILEASPSFFDIKGVIARGPVSTLSEADLSEPDARGWLDRQRRGLDDEQALFFLGLDDIASFDFGKLARATPAET
jgi:hypothetical protein